MATVILVRGTLVFCAAFLATVAAKRLPSESRHLLWLGVIAGFLLIPLAWFALPSVDLRIQRGSAANLHLPVAPVLSRLEYARVIQRTSVDAILTLQPAARHMSWMPAALLGVWMAGVLFLSARMAAGMLRLRHLARGGWSEPRLQALAVGVAADLSFRRGFRLILSAPCRIPFSFGWSSPVIVLPASSIDWPNTCLRPVLIHEMAHLRRRDVLTQSPAYAVCVLFWFAPPLWLAYAAMLREAEICCDQHVIDQGVQGPEYARNILELVKASEGRMLLSCTSAGLGLKTMMKDRITRLLRLRPAGRSFLLRDAAKVMLICLCCLAPVVAIFASAQSQPLAKNDPLFGTWVNRDNVRTLQGQKFSITPDGHELDYCGVSDAKPYGDCWDTVEKKWVDSAGRHRCRYKVVKHCSPDAGGSFEGFGVARVSLDGGTIETVFAQYGYPEDVTPLGSYYTIAYRQR